MTDQSDDRPAADDSRNRQVDAIVMPGADQQVAQAVQTDNTPAIAIRFGSIARAWWPLTVSWLMMVAEGPLVVVMAARLPDPEINLAALGGIVRAMTFAIESPLLVLLTASATLSRDWDAFRRLRVYAFWGIGLMTVVHLILSITPAYYWVIREVIGAPEEIIEPARTGMIITIPYLALVAYRRVNHGVLIRFGYARWIAIGTFIRLLLVIGIMIAGLFLGSVSGVIIGALTMTGGVLIEAIFIEWRTRPIRRHELRAAPASRQVLTASKFIKFYIPLSTTTIALFLIHPVISAALSRMPDPIISLAVWPSVIGVAGMLAAGGAPLVDVLVTVLDYPGALAQVRRFALLVGACTAVLALALAATPLGTLWFGTISGLNDPLYTAARQMFWFILPYPIVLVLQSLYQGVLTYQHRTNRITEAVFLYTATVVAILVIGIMSGEVSGIYISAIALTAGVIIQALWMRWRSLTWVNQLDAQRRGSVDALRGQN
jgi:hypothetical protein